jgi:hypothetical protein
MNQGNADIRLSDNRMERIVGGDGIQLSGARNVTIDGNQIIDGTPGENNDHVDSVQVLAPVTDTVIRRNYTGAGIRGFILQPKSTKVCVATGLPGCAGGVENVDWVFSEYYSGPLGRITIENNVLTGLDFSLRFLRGFDSKIVNNTFWASTSGTAAHGVLFWPTRPEDPVQDERIVFANNLMRDLNVADGTGFATRAANIAINIWSPPAGGERYGLGETPAFTAGSLALSVADTSARNRGVPGIGPDTDFDGAARDSAPDIGAYEAPPAPAVLPPKPGMGSVKLARRYRLRRSRRFAFTVSCSAAGGCRAATLTATGRTRPGGRRVTFRMKIPALRQGTRKKIKATVPRKSFALIRKARGRTVKFRVTGPVGFKTRALSLTVGD